MLYLPNDQYVGGSIERYGEYSPMEYILFRYLLRNNDVVIETGANMGSLTVPLGQMAGKVVAFEPQHVLYKIAQANIAINNLTNVELYNQAVGAEAGIVQIPVYTYDDDEANYGLIGESRWGKGMETRVVTIDSLGLDRVDFVKIDVEGMEEKVLQGAKVTIASQRPIMLVENDRAEHAVSLVEYVYSLDYTPYWFVTPLYHPNNFYENSTNDFGGQASFNMLCWPNEKPLRIGGLEKVTSTDDVVCRANPITEMVVGR